MTVSLDRFSLVYNPNAEYAFADDPISHVLKAREKLSDSLDGDIEYKLEKQIYKEMILLGIEVPDERTNWTHLTDDERVEIVEHTEAEVNDQVHSVLLAIDVVQNGTPLGRSIPSDVEAAGMVCAYWAHDGRFRLNGTPYYTHPASVAEIVRYAWDNNPMIARYAPFMQAQREREIFIALGHDTFEDDQQDDGQSFLLTDSKFRVTPLFIKKLFEVLGRDDGDMTADSLLRLTKIKQATGKQTVANYRKQMADDPEAGHGKLADNLHNNTIDPRGKRDIEKAKIVRNAERRYNYGVDREELLLQLGKYSLVDQWIGHVITGIDKTTFDEYCKDGPTFNYSLIPSRQEAK